jgi:hypothetical protein
MAFGGMGDLLKARMTGSSRDSLSRIDMLPVASNEKDWTIMKTLDMLCTACLIGKSELLPLLILEMDRRTTKYGVTPFSAPALALLGLLLAAYLNVPQGGRVCCTKALEIADRFGALGIQCRARCKPLPTPIDPSVFIFPNPCLCDTIQSFHMCTFSIIRCLYRIV